MHESDGSTDPIHSARILFCARDMSERKILELSSHSLSPLTHLLLLTFRLNCKLSLLEGPNTCTDADDEHQAKAKKARERKSTRMRPRFARRTKQNFRIVLLPRNFGRICSTDVCEDGRHLKHVDFVVKKVAKEGLARQKRMG